MQVSIDSPTAANESEVPVPVPALTNASAPAQHVGPSPKHDKSRGELHKVNATAPLAAADSAAATEGRRLLGEEGGAAVGFGNGVRDSGGVRLGGALLAARQAAVDTVWRSHGDG